MITFHTVVALNASNTPATYSSTSYSTASSSSSSSSLSQSTSSSTTTGATSHPGTSGNSGSTYSSAGGVNSGGGSGAYTTSAGFSFTSVGATIVGNASNSSNSSYTWGTGNTNGTFSTNSAGGSTSSGSTSLANGVTSFASTVLNGNSITWSSQGTTVGVTRTPTTVSSTSTSHGGSGSSWATQSQTLTTTSMVSPVVTANAGTCTTKTTTSWQWIKTAGSSLYCTYPTSIYSASETTGYAFTASYSYISSYITTAGMITLTVMSTKSTSGISSTVASTQLTTTEATSWIAGLSISGNSFVLVTSQVDVVQSATTWITAAALTTTTTTASVNTVSQKVGTISVLGSNEWAWSVTVDGSGPMNSLASSIADSMIPGLLTTTSAISVTSNTLNLNLTSGQTFTLTSALSGYTSSTISGTTIYYYDQSETTYSPEVTATKLPFSSSSTTNETTTYSNVVVSYVATGQSTWTASMTTTAISSMQTTTEIPVMSYLLDANGRITSWESVNSLVSTSSLETTTIATSTQGGAGNGAGSTNSSTSTSGSWSTATTSSGASQASASAAWSTWERNYSITTTVASYGFLAATSKGATQVTPYVDGAVMNPYSAALTDGRSWIATFPATIPYPFTASIRRSGVIVPIIYPEGTSYASGATNGASTSQTVIDYSWSGLTMSYTSIQNASWTYTTSVNSVVQTSTSVTSSQVTGYGVLGFADVATLSAYNANTAALMAVGGQCGADGAMEGGAAFVGCATIYQRDSNGSSNEVVNAQLTTMAFSNGVVAGIEVGPLVVASSASIANSNANPFATTIFNKWDTSI